MGFPFPPIVQRIDRSLILIEIEADMLSAISESSRECREGQANKEDG